MLKCYTDYFKSYIKKTEKKELLRRTDKKSNAKKVLCGYEVQMNMYIFDFKRKSIFNIFICHMLFQDEPTHF